ncbi:MAG: hypothetical protein J0H09_06550 [Burkholderiales bacterium]|nr:hypothetical protein [Burkholderiales bacterium]ODU70859.1 MAG: hypothetical protein ABT05_01340 [Lautropia sp. SCN 66-9]
MSSNTSRQPTEADVDYTLPPRVDRIVYTIGQEADTIARMLVSAGRSDDRHAIHALTCRLMTLASAAMSLASNDPLGDIERDLFPMGDPKRLVIPGPDASPGILEETSHDA